MHLAAPMYRGCHCLNVVVQGGIVEVSLSTKEPVSPTVVVDEVGDFSGAECGLAGNKVASSIANQLQLPGVHGHPPCIGQVPADLRGKLRMPGFPRAPASKVRRWTASDLSTPTSAAKSSAASAEAANNSTSVIAFLRILRTFLKCTRVCH